MLNDAERMSEAKGLSWYTWAKNTSASGDSTSTTVNNFAQNYLLPYIQYTKYETSGNVAYVYLPDGTYFTLKKGNCIDFGYDTNGEKSPNFNGRDKFFFLLCPLSVSSMESGKIITYKSKVQDTRAKLLQVCKDAGYYCSSLIEADGWQIKDDYPYKL